MSSLALLSMVIACEPDTVPINGPRPLRVGDTTITVQIAAEPATRLQGYMGVSDIPEDEGMLFIFPAPRKQEFWMKDCLVDIDIAYIDDSYVVTDVHTMKKENVKRNPANYTRYPSSREVRYALEVRAGWFARHGIVAGSKIDLSEARRYTLVR